MNQEALLVSRRANLENETDIACYYIQFLTMSTLAAIREKQHSTASENASTKY